MVKKIIWSEHAHKSRKEILQYWIDKNKSPTYSVKLNLLFKEAVQLLSEFPRIGKLTTIEGVRAKIVRDYYIFYQEKSDRIFILSIWDTRQDPQSTDKKLK
jgi:addiction module RelE/StbE family toxin